MAALARLAQEAVVVAAAATEPAHLARAFDPLDDSFTLRVALGHGHAGEPLANPRSQPRLRRGERLAHCTRRATVRPMSLRENVIVSSLPSAAAERSGTLSRSSTAEPLIFCRTSPLCSPSLARKLVGSTLPSCSPCPPPTATRLASALARTSARSRRPERTSE